MSEPTYKVTVLYGRSESRSWLEAEMLPDGRLMLVGMGSRTDFDRDGKIKAHKVAPTGLRMLWPPIETPKTLLQRLFS